VNHRIGIDIGGTFTDFVLINGENGNVEIHKQLTTPDNPSRAVLDGIDTILANANIKLPEISEIVHGTTLVTNAIIERRGCPTGMLVTKGMQDVIDIGRERRYDLFDLRLVFPKPLVDKRRRREITERVESSGAVSVSLDLAETRAAVRDLIESEGIEALAICFLNSYVNSANEDKAIEMLRQEFGELHVSGSNDVVPFAREYERWTTTTMNAYVQPVVERYLTSLEENLGERAFKGRFYVMTSSGGMVGTELARRYPIRLLESGPAAGALMSARHGQSIGVANVLSFDMGGTTAKGALIRDGSPLKTYEMEVARVHEFKAGSGLPAKAPAIDMIEIGAGGGSIAEIDDRGVIRVGPQSAGALPGPACYLQNGEAPTLTDANLVLGYLNPDFFLGGRMKLDKPAAERAIETHIGQPLGLDVVRSAWGIHDIVNENIAQAFRVHASERGFDYRNASMVGFGGSGPIHAARVARKLKVPRVVFPMAAGVMSAFGLLISPFSFEIVSTKRTPISDLDENKFRNTFAPLEEKVYSLLDRSGIARETTHVARKLDIRYEGQGYEIEVPVGESPNGLAADFENAYRKVFSSLIIDGNLEIVNWKLEAIGPIPIQSDRFEFPGSIGGETIKNRRQVYFAEADDFVEVPVYDRYALAIGAGFSGPAIIEERESTIVIGFGDVVEIDEYRNIIVTIADRKEGK